MRDRNTRREFLGQAGLAACGFALTAGKAKAQSAASKPAQVSHSSSARVIIIRDEAIARGKVDEHREQIRKMLDAAMLRLTGATDVAAAYRQLFRPEDKVGIKMNMLGFNSRPAVAMAIAAGLRQAGVPEENIIIWDRADHELAGNGFKMNKSASGIKCLGTNSAGDYLREVETHGSVKSRFSPIVAKQVTALISVPALKDHELCGVTLGLKNWFGAIDNPGNYHRNNCDPYIADLVSHPYIAPKWRLTVCDAIRAMCNGGPLRSDQYTWPYCGLLVSTDKVALDAVGAQIIEAKRKEMGLKPFAADKRPYTYLATCAARGLGVADIAKIEKIEI